MPDSANHFPRADGQSAISLEDMQALSDAELPMARLLGLKIDEIEPGFVTVRAPFTELSSRPGGTVSGPVMMCMADLALYAVVLSLIGKVPLAVTTQLGINFLRKPSPGDVIAHGSILKMGKRLAIGEVSIYSIEEGDEILVAHVTGTYSVPPTTPVVPPTTPVVPPITEPSA